ncbi:hypothetical protein AB9F46_21285 [Rhizobium leguminosarum]|uniref:hypothetical protein n=1 Tax=Rhizobium leguminosarum TaxID=384 RepID=UPI003F9B2E61
MAVRLGRNTSYNSSRCSPLLLRTAIAGSDGKGEVEAQENKQLGSTSISPLNHVLKKVGLIPHFRVVVQGHLDLACRQRFRSDAVWKFASAASMKGSYRFKAGMIA